MIIFYSLKFIIHFLWSSFLYKKKLFVQEYHITKSINRNLKISGHKSQNRKRKGKLGTLKGECCLVVCNLGFRKDLFQTRNSLGFYCRLALWRRRASLHHPQPPPTIATCLVFQSPTLLGPIKYCLRKLNKQIITFS